MNFKMTTLPAFSTLGLILSLVSSLSGCAVVAMKEQKEIVAWCEQRSNSDPLVKSLKGKLPLVQVTEVTAEMMAIQEVPNDGDMNAIKALISAMHECRGKARSWQQTYAPRYSEVNESTWHKYDLVMSELLRKNISFGNANSLLMEAYLEGQKKYSSQAQMAEQLELQRAQVLMQAGAAMQTQSRLPPPRTQTTNCRWVGNTLNCTSF